MGRNICRSSLLALLAAGLPGAVGCGFDGGAGGYVTTDRMDKGLVIILPGIEGVSEMNRDIRRGLLAAGVPRALPIHSWGRPIPGVGMIMNQVDFIGNRLAGVRVASLVKNYQDSHPDRPVYVVGHSGGGGVAVFSAEALSDGRQIDGLVLLSASISKGYDLTKALRRCRNGIVNFYNPEDVGLLGIGTTVMGNVDGMHGPSAGLVSFDTPGAGASEAKRAAYRKLHQVNCSGLTHGGDPHAATTHVGFVSRHVAPWILKADWPASGHVAGGTARPPDRPAAPSDSAPTAAPRPADPQPEADTPPEDKPRPPDKPVNARHRLAWRDGADTRSAWRYRR